MSSKKKELIPLELVVVGHVDCGKTTVCGRLIYEHGNIDRRTKERLTREAEELGRGSFKYAFILERVRDRGLCVNTFDHSFNTKKHKVFLCDSPGNRDFIRNMTQSCLRADAAILIIDASNGAFENGISINGQMLGHARIAYIFGIKELIVCVNKMDSVGYSESRFDFIVEETMRELKRIGFSENRIKNVPISAWKGDNILLDPPNDNLPWWKEGKTEYGGMKLPEIIDTIEPKEKQNQLPVRLPIQDVYKIRKIGTVPVGRVETGCLRVMQKVIIAPQDIITQVESIEHHHQRRDSAESGTNIGFTLMDKTITKKSLRRGAVLGDLYNDPPREALEFNAQVFVLQNVPAGIKVGYTPMIDVHTAHILCRITKIIETYNKHGTVIKKNPEVLVRGDNALVRFKPTKPMVVEKIDRYPSLGRLSVRDMRQTVMIGVVTDVKKKKLAVVWDHDEKERVEYVKDINQTENFTIRLRMIHQENERIQIGVFRSFLLL